jgi:DUF4097 and DUF4098 domain-containing protein YvlB
MFLSLVGTQLSPGQEIFNSFDWDNRHKYTGSTTYEYELPVGPGTQRILNVHDIAGDVSIEGEPGHNARIVEIVKIRSTSQNKAKDLYERVKAQVTVSDSGYIELEGHDSWNNKVSFRYNIKLPTDYNLRVQTAGGDINVVNMKGGVYVRTSGGDIDLEEIQGRLTATTSGGDITVSSVKGLVVLRTSGGDLEITNTEGKLEATTSGGDILVQNILGDIEIYTSGGDLELEDVRGSQIVGRTAGGDIKLKEVEGVIAMATSGGTLDIEDIVGSLEASTAGGDIELETTEGPVEVTTSGGDIDGEDIQGAIRAQTSGGDISVVKTWNRDLSDHDIKLKTSRGTIRLSLPRNFPATIRATVEDKFSVEAIDSEIPLNISKHHDEVRGEGVIGEGTYRVTLRTRYDSIIITEE